jgi:ribosomal-protein-alanine N-acetyltransferase
MESVAHGNRRVKIVQPSAQDAPEFLAKARASASLHHPWISPPADDESFASYLARIHSDEHQGFLLRTDDELVGVININNIVMGAFRSGYLGYYAFSGYEGRGLMSQGLRLVLAHAFGALDLHRLEANIQPGNTASLRLAERTGFVKEGYSEKYLLINGAWRDHERWAITTERFG